MANQLTMADIEQIKILAETTDWSARKIAKVLNRDRGTVSKYIAQFRSKPTDGSELSPEPPPPDSKPAKVITGNQPESRSFCEPYRDKIEPLVEQGVTADRIHRELVSEYGFTHSYQSVSRFVRSLKDDAPKRVWRMECEPGEEAQVDFGVIKTLITADGKMRFSNVLRVTLSFSRKGYTETLPSQNTECLIRSLENAFRHFGGTPKTVRIDNLKAGVRKADWYDPELNPKLADFANHYGTVIIPTRPYTPQHKGKVERDVAYVKSSALKGKEFISIQQQNIHLKEWEASVADLRIHGTTRKQVQSQFLNLEKPALQPLPASLFPCYSEGPRKVHRDSYIDVEKAYYDVPLEFTGTKVWVRWGPVKASHQQPPTIGSARQPRWAITSRNGRWRWRLTDLITLSEFCKVYFLSTSRIVTWWLTSTAPVKSP